jgi:hypothetical protein
MGYQQHDGARGIDLNRADSVPAWLSRFVHAVRTYRASFVLEHQRRLFE